MNNAVEAKNITVDDIMFELSSIDNEIEILKKKRTSWESDLSAHIEADVKTQLAGKDYGCGTANIETAEHTVKCVVSKKVKWEQSKLAEVYNLIKSSGEDPSEYIKTNYDVSESAYKNWPEKISKVFEPARTVEISKPKITFERKE